MSTPTNINTTTGKAFPSPISVKGKDKALPALIGRTDQPNGKWTVKECRAVRGEPCTNIDEKIMLAPSQSDDVARLIRAHELMHSKVSPDTEQFGKWIQREIASSTAMTVTEELRVNYLCSKAGFDMSLLQDGSEMATGERLASTNDWAGCVATAFATAGTGANKAFLNGVRRHNRAWGDSLLDISKRALKEIKKADRYGNLAESPDSLRDPNAQFTESGFVHTERIAEWCDRLASFPAPEERKGDKSGKGSKKKETHHSNKDVVGDDQKGDKSGERHKGISPCDSHGAPEWAQLRVVKCAMPKHHSGSLGKRRIATNMGRRPRRIARLLTDPQRRIFDRTTKGTGGMVILDASGSMSFTENEISQILEHAQGATVAMYSDRNRDNVPNMWVIAEKGKMVEKLPEYGWGNGVDFPAIQWGVKNKTHKKAPLVWVTDGGVCGLRDGFSPMLSLQCITYARKHGYIVVPHVTEAIKQLKSLANGGTAHSVYPRMFAHTWQEHYGFPISERKESDDD